MGEERKHVYCSSFCELDDKILGSSMNFNGLIVHYKDEGKSRFLGRFPNEENDAWRLHNYVLSDGDYLYFIPDRSKYIHIYDVKQKRFDSVDVRAGGRINATTAIMMNKHIIFASIDQRLLIVLNVENRELRHITLPENSTIVSEIVVKKGHIYLADKKTDCIYECDLSNQDVRIINLKAEGKGFGTIATDGEKIYLSGENIITIYDNAGFEQRIIEYPDNYGMKILRGGNVDFISGFKDIEERCEKPFAFSRLLDNKLFLFPFRTNMIIEIDLLNKFNTVEFYVSEEDETMESLSSKLRLTHCHYLPAESQSNTEVLFVSTCTKRLYKFGTDLKLYNYEMIIDNSDDLYMDGTGYMIREEGVDGTLKDYINSILC